MKEIKISFLFTVEDSVDTIMYMVKSDVNEITKDKVINFFKKLVIDYGMSYPAYIGSYTDTEKEYAEYKSRKLFPDMYEKLEEVKKVFNG